MENTGKYSFLGEICVILGEISLFWVVFSLFRPILSPFLRKYPKIHDFKKKSMILRNPYFAWFLRSNKIYSFGFSINWAAQDRWISIKIGPNVPHFTGFTSTVITSIINMVTTKNNYITTIINIATDTNFTTSSDSTSTDDTVTATFTTTSMIPATSNRWLQH